MATTVLAGMLRPIVSVANMTLMSCSKNRIAMTSCRKKVEPCRVEPCKISMVNRMGTSIITQKYTLDLENGEQP